MAAYRKVNVDFDEEDAAIENQPLYSPAQVETNIALKSASVRQLLSRFFDPISFKTRGALNEALGSALDNPPAGLDPQFAKVYSKYINSYRGFKHTARNGCDHGNQER